MSVNDESKEEIKECYKTFASFIKPEHDLYAILTYMSKISKNVYNTTIYINSIYEKYKDVIYCSILNNFKTASSDEFNDAVKRKLKFFYDLHSNENSVMKTNNEVLYNIIKRVMQNKVLDSTNFKSTAKMIKDKYKKEVKFTSVYEYDYIIYSILKSFYIRGYKSLEYKIRNKIKIEKSDINKQLIKDVLEGNFLFETKRDFKKEAIIKLKIEKPHTDRNIVTRVIYQNLGENKGKIPSDLIINIISRAFQNFASYWALRNKGIASNKPKYLKKDGLFILPYFYRSFKITENKARLFIGDHVADNLNKIIGKDKFICLNIKNKYKKYVDRKHMKEVKGKVLKSTNFVVDKMYIEKNNENIFESQYIEFNIPKKISSKNIKLIEINPIYKGHAFKINYKYTSEPPKKHDRKVDFKEAISIDLGMRNLMTIYDPSGDQKIIKGSYLSSINSFYNHKIDAIKSKISLEKDEKIKDNLIRHKRNLLIKRMNKITDFFNKLVKYLYITYENKTTIVIGYNLNWKRGVNMGKKNNRKFYEIPYSILLTKLKGKMPEKIVITEESYTSKCDALNLEKIGKKDKYDGERTKRGLFKSKKGLINADLNGAINIMRKVTNLKQIDGNRIMNPKVVNIFRDACL